jgi:diguanylate cyclase (GGDEF)-like protein/PAS domain S-box-containing protein
MEVEDEALSLGILRDISEQVKAEAALRESEERYALAARAANDGLWDWNLRTNTVYYSRRWKALLGYEHFELSQQPKEWLDRIHPEDLDQVKVSLSAHMKGLTRHFESEHRMQHKDGTYRWMLTRGIAVQDSANFAYRFTGSHTDITARKQAEQQLMHDALHDSLTGLPNRTLFLDRLSQVLLRTHRKGDQFAVLFLDLDRFKVINDSLGHQSGDNLLIQITARLHACLRSIDTIARLGGDEFVVLLADITDDDDAGRAANRILESLAPPFELSGREIFVSASIGVVRGDYTYERPEDVLRDADIAMYQAKASGKACAVIFEPAMRKEALSRLEIESDLRQAIARQELSLHYQPIVSLVDGRLVGFEALLRWTHPQRGNIPPSAFIPIAEDTGLIIPIGWWVLNEACQQLRAWQHLHPEGPPLTISVNISGRQLTQPDLINKIRSILEGSGIPASQVRLEITESTLVHNSQDTLDVTHQLRQLGLQLHIDDFGTGYSSLSYIHSFPVNTIKIDRTFINRIGDNGNPTELVASILRFAHDLGMEAIAEGIETPEQLSRLQTLACPYGQGYLFSKPLPAEQAETLLSNPTLCVQSQSRQTTR